MAGARAERDRARALVKQGRHPAHVRRIQRAKQQLENQSSFKVVALEWIASKSNVSESYRNQLTRAFTKNLFPYIGRLPVREVTAALLLECLRRMESRGAAFYAIALCNWLSQMFRFAVRTLRADSDPAADLYGAFVRKPVQHSQPMSVADIARFREGLQSYGGFSNKHDCFGTAAVALPPDGRNSSRALGTCRLGRGCLGHPKHGCSSFLTPHSPEFWERSE